MSELPPWLQDLDDDADDFQESHDVAAYKLSPEFLEEKAEEFDQEQHTGLSLNQLSHLAHGGWLQGLETDTDDHEEQAERFRVMMAAARAADEDEGYIGEDEYGDNIYTGDFSQLDGRPDWWELGMEDDDG